jgi:hypothetical protein
MTNAAKSLLGLVLAAVALLVLARPGLRDAVRSLRHRDLSPRRESWGLL